MAGFSLRIDDELHQQLKRASDEDGRSMNDETVVAIKDYLARRRREKLIAAAAALTDDDRAYLDEFDSFCEAANLA